AANIVGERQVEFDHIASWHIAERDVGIRDFAGNFEVLIDHEHDIARLDSRKSRIRREQSERKGCGKSPDTQLGVHLVIGDDRACEREREKKKAPWSLQAVIGARIAVIGTLE